MNLELIDKCYENQYNIDLKQVHQKNCNVDYFEQALIDEISATIILQTYLYE